MPILMLHDENLAAAKAGLKTRLPHVRSSHLTEALAAGLGYRTHAALRAELAADAGLPAGLAVIDEASFVSRLQSLGYEAPVPALLGELVCSAEIPDRPIVQFRDGDRAANDGHYQDCKRLGRPMMMVKMARIYATLDWELFTLSIEDINRIFADVDGRTFSRRMLEHFQSVVRGAPGKPYFTGGPSTGWITKLLPATAHQLAVDYYRMLYPPMRAFARAKVRGGAA